MSESGLLWPQKLIFFYRAKIDILLSCFCHCVIFRVRVSVGLRVRVRVGFRLRIRVGFEVSVSSACYFTGNSCKLKKKMVNSLGFYFSK